MKFNYIDLLRYAENNPGNDIYYHPQKTWWTHTLDDVKQSSEMAVMFVKNNAEEMLADDTVDTETKEKVKDHVSKMEDPDFKIMLCPDGCPMYKVNVVKFVIDNLNKLSRLGEHGMLTLLAAHHQNCDGIITEDWKDLDPVVEAHIKENGHSRTLDNDDSIEAFDLVSKIRRRYTQKDFTGKNIPIVMAGSKPQRNDLCPCQSGKKFKNCHGQK